MKITITVDRAKIEKVLGMALWHASDVYERECITHVQEQVAKWEKGYKGDK